MKMNKMKWTLTTLAVFVLIMTFAAATQATVLRAFVSSTGADANTATNCAQAAPCKTFNAAIAVVTPGGELIALDTSGYGPITSINKAITIATVPGATAFVVAAAGTAAFTVNGAASDLIKLRNINFNGSGAAGTTGLRHNSGQLIVENCSFQQLTIGVDCVAKMDLINCNISGNGTGVISTGQGTEGSGSSTTVSTAQVRINGGNINANTLGLSQVNPNTNCFNIFVFAPNAVAFTNLMGNTTNQNCTAVCNTGGQAGSYTFGQTLK
jgi:hypothetical protein